MKLVKNLMVSLPVAAVVTGAAIASVVPAYAATTTSAETASNSCTVKVVGTSNSAGKSGSKFALSSDGSQATVAMVMTGDANCKSTVTLGSWEATKSFAFDKQTLFDHSTGTFGLGTHTLSVKKANCYFQLDLVTGASAAGIGGEPIYKGTPIKLLAFAQGGTQVCTTATPASTIPTPSVPTTPTPQLPAAPTAAVTVAPTALPNTGAGNVVGIFAIVAAAGAAMHRIFSIRRNRI